MLYHSLLSDPGHEHGRVTFMYLIHDRLWLGYGKQRLP